MKKWVSLVAVSLVLVACAGEKEMGAETEVVKSEAQQNVESSKEKETTEEKNKEQAAEEATVEVSWDEQILSADGKTTLLSGCILGTSLKIGSTLDEVTTELGTPDSDDYFAGAPLKSFGDIHISHLMDEEEVVAFFLTFNDAVSIDKIHELWGEPTAIAPMEIDGITESHEYVFGDYVASFQLTQNTPDKVKSVHVAKVK